MSDAMPANGRSNERRSRSELPDPAICRASDMGDGDLVNCLVQRASLCLYALSFGYGYLCRHPQRKEIAARTKAEQDKKNS